MRSQQARRRTTRIIGFHTLQLFPPAWDWRRVCEVAIATYQAAVGVVLWVHPQSIQHSSYEYLRRIMSAEEWAVVLWAIALAHVVCIWGNGRFPTRTPLMRVIASALHLTVLLLFGLCFIAADDYYRVVTTLFIALSNCASISIATEDYARALNRKTL